MDFYLSVDGTDVTGPHSRAEIATLFAQNAIPVTSRVCPAGANEWFALESALSTPEPPPIPVANRPISRPLPKGLSLEDRSELLDAYIQKYLAAGYRISSRTETAAQLVKPKHFSAGLAVICLVLAVLPFFIYLLVYLGERDKVVYISIASDGKVAQTTPKNAS